MRILFFAQLRDVAGCSAIELTGAAPSNAEALWQRLIERFPGLAPHRAAVRLARNGEYARPDTAFADGDEIALIPPVSGG